MGPETQKFKKWGLLGVANVIKLPFVKENLHILKGLYQLADKLLSIKTYFGKLEESGVYY